MHKNILMRQGILVQLLEKRCLRNGGATIPMRFHDKLPKTGTIEIPRGFHTMRDSGRKLFIVTEYTY